MKKAIVLVLIVVMAMMAIVPAVAIADDDEKIKIEDIKLWHKKKKLNRNQISIISVSNYIINRAQNYDSRVVSLGSFIFFSTETGDAWMLDYKEGVALCLVKDGEKLPL